MPSHRLTGPEFSPGIQAGSRYYAVNHQNHGLSVGINIAAYYHRNVSSSLLVNLELGYFYKVNKWKVGPMASYGLNFTKFPNGNYRVENGNVFKNKSNYRTNQLPAIGLQTAYNIKTEGKPLYLFIQYSSAFELDFVEVVPLLPHTFLNVGIESFL
jgi:hypothetical protein